MELELKHLSPYLPYKLHFLVNTEEYELTAIFTLDEYPLWAHNYWNEDSLCFYPEINKKQNYQGIGFKLNEIKPILRPLSDLFKLIDWDKNGDPYMIGYKYGIEKVFEDGEEFYANVYDADYCESPKCYIDITCFDWWLFEYHFDVLGLIKQGLAIDINTLNI